MNIIVERGNGDLKSVFIRRYQLPIIVYSTLEEAKAATGSVDDTDFMEVNGTDADIELLKSWWSKL